METIYQILSSHQKSRPSFEKGAEYKFFLKNRYLLDKMPRFSFLYESEDSYFDVMRANIIIYSYRNKELIEKEYKTLREYADEHPEMTKESITNLLKEKIVSQPCLNSNGAKIYMPFFTRSLNNIYLNETEKLYSSPYDSLMTSFNEATIDPFDLYGYQLYNSTFTRLILVKENPDKTEAAFFHYDTKTIYFVNSQGRLDDKVVLFDKYIKRPNETHMLERIIPVIDAYFDFDRSKMIESLYENKFLSGKLMSIIRKTTGINNEI